MTEAGFWSFVKSALRSKSMYWAPLHQAKQAARRPSQSSNKRLRFEYQCAHCKQWFPDKETVVDHIVPVGRLLSYDDIPGVVKRMFCEKEGFQVLCKKDHKAKTAEDIKQIRAND